MTNLDTKNLLSASLVNKTWKREARSILGQKRKCVAVIAGEKPFADATELNGMFGSSSALNTVNGISITIEPHECDISHRERTIHQVYGNLLQLPLKYLTFKWNSDGNTAKFPLGQVLLSLMAGSVTLGEVNIREIPMNARLEPQNVEFQDNLEGANTLHSKKLIYPSILVLRHEIFSVMPSIARCAAL